VAAALESAASGPCPKATWRGTGMVCYALQGRDRHVVAASSRLRRADTPWSAWYSATVEAAVSYGSVVSSATVLLLHIYFTVSFRINLPIARTWRTTPNHPETETYTLRL